MKTKLIHSVEFLKDELCFSKGDKVEFKSGINLIVGDQGTGKSTLLSALHKNDTELVKIKAEPCEYFYLDFEKHNPRIASHLDSTHFDAGTVLKSRFMSHGEVLLPIVEKCRNGKNALFFMDEPESGLSIRSQYLILNAMREAVDNKCQFIIATHSLILIEAMDEVYSLERRKWISGKEFINDQQKQK